MKIIDYIKSLDSVDLADFIATIKFTGDKNNIKEWLESENEIINAIDKLVGRDQKCIKCVEFKRENVKPVKNHICKYKGEWDKYHNGGKCSLSLCTHPVIGGKECYSTKFSEGVCDTDYIYYDCLKKDDFGWCMMDQGTEIRIDDNSRKCGIKSEFGEERMRNNNE